MPASDLDRLILGSAVRFDRSGPISAGGRALGWLCELEGGGVVIFDEFGARLARFESAGAALDYVRRRWSDDGSLRH